MSESVHARRSKVVERTKARKDVAAEAQKVWQALQAHREVLEERVAVVEAVGFAVEGTSASADRSRSEPLSRWLGRQMDWLRRIKPMDMA